MPATAVPVTTSTVAGVLWPATNGVAGDNVNGNSCPNGPNVMVLATNTIASPATVSFNTPYTTGPASLAIAEDSKSLAASETRLYGPFPVATYGETLTWTPSAATVKFIVIQHT